MKTIRRMVLLTTGEAGTLIKVINKCLWVKMDDGRTLSGGEKTGPARTR
jgi:hypothetical protein